MHNIVLFSYIDQTVELVPLIAQHAAVSAVVVPSNRTISDCLISFLKQRDIPVFIQPSAKKDLQSCHDFVRKLKLCSAELFITHSYSMILSRDILEIPQLGTVNMHNALLPQYRGNNVLNWAIINGEDETGTTLHWIGEGIDSGPVIGQSKVAITYDDTALTLRTRLITQSFALLDEMLPEILNGDCPGIVQEESLACYYHSRKPEDGMIDWTRTVGELYNFIRALVSPWPGAYYFDSEDNKVVFDQKVSEDDIRRLKQDLGYYSNA